MAYIATSGSTVKLWQIDTLQLIAEYATPQYKTNNKTSRISGFSIKPDSKFSLLLLFLWMNINACKMNENSKEYCE